MPAARAEPSSSLLTLQRSAGNAAVVSMMGLDRAPAATSAPVRPDLTIHRFYCLWDDKPWPDGSFTDQEDGTDHYYKWIPEKRDESLYRESARVPGWRMRSLYEPIPGAVKAKEDKPSGLSGEIVSSVGDVLDNTSVDISGGELTTSARRTSTVTTRTSSTTAGRLPRRRPRRRSSSRSSR